MKKEASASESSSSDSDSECAPKSKMGLRIIGGKKRFYNGAKGQTGRGQKKMKKG